MTRVAFHRGLYDGRDVDAAVKALADYAELKQEEEKDHWVVLVTAASASREKKVAGELMNFALGKTVEARR